MRVHVVRLALGCLVNTWTLNFEAIWFCAALETPESFFGGDSLCPPPLRQAGYEGLITSERRPGLESWECAYDWRYDNEVFSAIQRRG